MDQQNMPWGILNIYRWHIKMLLGEQKDYNPEVAQKLVFFLHIPTCVDQCWWGDIYSVGNRWDKAHM